jgi:hypothetical protein
LVVVVLDLADAVLLAETLALVLVEDFWACPPAESAGIPNREEDPVRLTLRGCAASAGLTPNAHTAIPIANVRAKVLKTIVRGYRRTVPARVDLREMLQHQRSYVANAPLLWRLGNLDAAQDQGPKRVFAPQ